jgi:hypothetical protein
MTTTAAATAAAAATTTTRIRLRKPYDLSAVLVAFAKLPTAIIRFAMSILLSAWNNLAPTGSTLTKFCI